MKLPHEYMKIRNEAFRKLPIEDWRTIIDFEQIIKNYFKLIKLEKQAI